MARYKINLTAEVEHDEESSGSVGLVALSQSFASAARRMIGEGQYRGKPIKVTDCKVTRAQRIA